MQTCKHLVKSMYKLYKWALCNTVLFLVWCLHLLDGDKVYKVSVKIERLSCKKPFLGGYRNKTTGQEYHNASSQTQPGMWNVEPQVERSGLQLSHQTQTEEQEHLLMQTRNDKSTQMTGIGVYIPNIADHLIPPHKYVTADEYQSRLLQQVGTYICSVS